jgi:hypothetical protein
MKSIIILLALLCSFSFRAKTQNVQLQWQVVQDTVNTSVYFYHKNMAVSSSGRSAILLQKNDIDYIQVFDPNGLMLYDIETDSVWLYNVVFDSSDNIYLTGNTWPFGQEAQANCLFKYDSFGNFVFEKLWNQPNVEFLGTIRMMSLPNGNIVIAGNYAFVSPNSSNDFYLLCYNTDGDLIWDYSYSSQGILIDIIKNIFVDEESNIYFAAMSQNGGFFAYYDLVIAKLNATGDLLWSDVLDYSDTFGKSARAEAISKDAFGNVLLVGNTSVGSDQGLYITTPLVIKLNDINGEVISANEYSIAQIATAKNIIADNDGNYYMNVISRVDTTILVQQDILITETLERHHHILKFNSNNELLWNFEELSDSDLDIESYDLIWVGNHLANYNYFEGQSRVVLLSADGQLNWSYTYPSPIFYSGQIKENLISLEGSFYTLMSSQYATESFNPYVVLSKFDDNQVGMPEVSLEDIILYPNPANDQFRILSDNEIKNVKIFSVDGRMLRSYPNGIQQFDVAYLASGIYVVRAEVGQQILSMQLVK